MVTKMGCVRLANLLEVIRSLINKYTNTHGAAILFKILILFVPTAPQTAPEDFQLTAASSECVKLTYNNVSYPNGPPNGLIYQVTLR